MNDPTTVEPGKCTYGHDYPCGHGECEKTGQWDERASESVRFPGVRWSPADLDRCEHGRHSIDSCYDCPDGKSRGNPYLDPFAGPKIRETRIDRNEIRIGTMVRGEPIFVRYRDQPRGEDSDGN